MLKLLRYLTKKSWALAVLAVGFVVLQVWLDLTLPDYMADITLLVHVRDPYGGRENARLRVREPCGIDRDGNVCRENCSRFQREYPRGAVPDGAGVLHAGDRKILDGKPHHPLHE